MNIFLASVVFNKITSRYRMPFMSMMMMIRFVNSLFDGCQQFYELKTLNYGVSVMERKPQKNPKFHYKNRFSSGIQHKNRQSAMKVKYIYVEFSWKKNKRMWNTVMCECLFIDLQLSTSVNERERERGGEKIVYASLVGYEKSLWFFFFLGLKSWSEWYRSSISINQMIALEFARDLVEITSLNQHWFLNLWYYTNHTRREKRFVHCLFLTNLWIF